MALLNELKFALIYDHWSQITSTREIPAHPPLLLLTGVIWFEYDNLKAEKATVTELSKLWKNQKLRCKLLGREIKTFAWKRDVCEEILMHTYDGSNN